MPSDHKITQQEIIDLFGDDMPIAAIQLIQSDKPIEEIRSGLKEIAAEECNRFTEDELAELAAQSLPRSATSGIRVRWSERHQLYIFESPRFVSATSSPETLIKVIRTYSLDDSALASIEPKPQEKKPIADLLASF